MITKEQAISDIELRLLQSNPSDDSELEKDQIALWLQITLNKLVKQEVTAAFKRGDTIPPIYIVREEGIELAEEEVDDIDDFKQRIWLELENDVLDLNNDRGIIRVEDYDGNLITKTTIDQLSMIRDLRFSRPSLNNILYHRVGKKVFVEGFNTADLDYNPIIVYYIPKQNVIEMEDDDEILVTDQVLPFLLDSCVEYGKMMLYGTQADVNNDGVDNKNVNYHTAISNPSAQEQGGEQTNQ